MSGYLFFRKTGVKEIDKILSKLEEAGHAYHHTSQWQEEGYSGEPSYVDQIQKVADDAANQWVNELDQTR